MTAPQPNRQPRRSGLAPLEMVMSLPFLVGLAAMIFSVGVLTLARTTSDISARHEVWKHRDVKHKSNKLKAVQRPPTHPLKVLGEFSLTNTLDSAIGNLNPLAGMVYGERERSVRLYVGLGQKKARGRAAVLTNTWDSAALRADGKGNFNQKGPHVGVLRRIGVVTLAVSSLQGVSSVLDIKSQKVPEDDEIREAKDDLKKEQEKVAEEIRKLSEKRDKEHGEYLEAKKDREDLEAEQRQVNSRLDEIEEGLAGQEEPKDAALLAEQAELEKRKSELPGEISDAKQFEREQYDEYDAARRAHETAKRKKEEMDRLIDQTENPQSEQDLQDQIDENDRRRGG